MWHTIVSYGIEILLLVAAVAVFSNMEPPENSDDDWHVHPMNKESMNYKE